MRYNNRIPPGTSLTTADHRLERVTSGDKRAALRTALPRLPSTAPGYIVLTVGDTANGWYTIEAGFAAFQYLMQANILGLGGWLTTPLTPAERTAIQTALGIPSADYPVIIFSTGQLLTGASEQPAMNLALPVRASSGPPVRIEYTLPQAAQVRFTITDLCGRQVAAWTESRAAGPQVTTWPAEVPAGIYFCHVAAGELAADLRLGVVR